MEQKRYSTGTKGRLMKHADECRELIRFRSPTPALAREFIDFLDPAGEDRIWQRFESPTDLLPALDAWLSGEDPAPAAPKPSGGLSSLRVKLPSPCDLKFQSALSRTRGWLAETATRQTLEKMTPAEAAEAALVHLAEELRD